MRKVLAFTALVTLLACSSAPAQQANPAGSDVAARIGDRAITLNELDQQWQQANPAQHAEATQLLYDGRRNALEQIVVDTLLSQAASAKGMSAEAYEEAEIARRIKPITDADVVTFYQANRNEMQGRPLDAMSPAINRYLQDQQRATARQALITELKRSGPAVRVMFDPPRVPVEIAADDPSLGNTKAPVTIVEFSDFQCPFCQRVAPTLKQVREKYGDKVRIVWKDFPLTQIHPQAFKASEAAHCAGEQGKYWEYHDRLFGNQQALEPESLKRYASDLGMNAADFTTCLDSSKYAERVRAGVSLGTRLGINSTPMLYVNGRLVQGAQPFEVFATVIDEELERAGSK